MSFTINLNKDTIFWTDYDLKTNKYFAVDGFLYLKNKNHMTITEIHDKKYNGQFLSLKNGKLIEKGYYSNNQPIGEWYTYKKNGTIKRKIVW